MPSQRISVRADSLGVILVIIAAGALSFSTLYKLALAVDWPPHLAWLFPIAIDVYALVATRLWLRTPGPSPERRQAALNAVAAVVLSVAGNTVQHLADAGVLQVGWQVIVLVSAVPPAVMALTVHLAVQLGGSSAVPEPEAVPEATVAGATPEPAPEEAGAEGEAEGEGRPVGVLDWARLPEAQKLDLADAAYQELVAAGVTVTGAILGERLGVTDRTGRTYLRKIA